MESRREYQGILEAERRVRFRRGILWGLIGLACLVIVVLVALLAVSGAG